MAECSVEGCGRDVLARYLCGAHYERWRRGSDMTAKVKERRHGCSVDGCYRTHFGGGLCKLHYQRNKKHGDPLAVHLKRCWVCDHPARAEIEGMILRGDTYPYIAARFDMNKHNFWCHARDHMGFVRGPGGGQCSLCSHPERDEIENALISGRSQGSVAKEYGLNRSTLYRHMLPAHIAKDALTQLRRLEAVRRLSP